MRDHIVRGLETELEAAEKRIEELEKDLALNAEMLARQCDMAREAETNALKVEARAKELEAAIKNAIDQFEGHKHEDVFGHRGHMAEETRLLDDEAYAIAKKAMKLSGLHFGGVVLEALKLYVGLNQETTKERAETLNHELCGAAVDMEQLRYYKLADVARILSNMCYDEIPGVNRYQFEKLVDAFLIFTKRVWKKEVGMAKRGIGP